MKKATALLVLNLLFGATCLMAQVAGTGGGSTATVVPSGGSGSGDVTATANNLFTLTNSFLKPVYIGTNGVTYGSGYNLVSGATMLHVVPLGSVAGNVEISVDSLGLGNQAGIAFTAGANNRMHLFMNSSGNGVLDVGKGGAAFDLRLGDGTTNMFSLTPTTAALGFNSSTAYTFPGTTWTSANGLNINSDTLWFNNSKMVNIGTNSAIEGNLTIHQSIGVTGMVIRSASSGTAYPFLLLSSTGTEQASINSTGSGVLQQLVLVSQSGGARFSTTSLSLISSSGFGYFRMHPSQNADIIVQGGTNSNNGVIISPGQPGINSVGYTNMLIVRSNGIAIGQGNVSPVPISLSGYTNFPVTPGTIAAQGAYVTNMSVAGILVGADVHANMSIARAGLIPHAQCTNNGVATVFINNYSSGGIDPGVPTIYVRYFQP